VLAPRRGAQDVVVTAAGVNDRVTVGGRSLEARHFVLTGPGGRRDVWADEQGRVLRVVLAADGTEAVRDDPPR
jgi:hypothetical protein